MIRSGKKPFEVSVRTKTGLEVIPVGAWNKEEAKGIVIGKYGIRSRDIVEVS